MREGRGGQCVQRNVQAFSNYDNYTYSTFYRNGERERQRLRRLSSEGVALGIPVISSSVLFVKKYEFLGP